MVPPNYAMVFGTVTVGYAAQLWPLYQRALGRAGTVKDLCYELKQFGALAAEALGVAQSLREEDWKFLHQKLQEDPMDTAVGVGSQYLDLFWPPVLYTAARWGLRLHLSDGAALLLLMQQGLIAWKGLDRLDVTPALQLLASVETREGVTP